MWPAHKASCKAWRNDSRDGGTGGGLLMCLSSSSPSTEGATRLQGHEMSGDTTRGPSVQSSPAPARLPPAWAVAAAAAAVAPLLLSLWRRQR
jgi:hypothetical protein